MYVQVADKRETRDKLVIYLLFPVDITRKIVLSFFILSMFFFKCIVCNYFSKDGIAETDKIILIKSRKNA